MWSLAVWPLLQADSNCVNPSSRTAEGLAQLNSNDYLILASTFHSIHAIAARISPVPGSSGVETIEAETFKMTCLQTPTGEYPAVTRPTAETFA